VESSKHILVVDDETDLVDLVSYNLKKEGYAVDTASDGEVALAKIRKVKYALLVLDLLLPGLQGIELCRILRSDPKTVNLPIIMLTAKGEEVDKILGLEMGADDYMTKPFSPRELVARVKAVLRRSAEKPAAEKILKQGDIEIDKERYIVSIKGRPIKLSATEFKLLLFLAERKGKVFSRDQLLDAIWRDEAFVEPRTVDVHIRRLRAHIEENAANPGYIKTMRGIGYFFDGK
jgi:phosphate regulon transcriptional regulator PhoB